MTGETIESHYARCLRPARQIDDPEDDDWETLGPEGTLLICPDCITPEEQQSMDDRDMELADELRHCARASGPLRQRTTPSASRLGGARTNEGASFVCPGCITAEERRVLDTDGDDQ